MKKGKCIVQVQGGVGCLAQRGCSSFLSLAPAMQPEARAHVMFSSVVSTAETICSDTEAGVSANATVRVPIVDPRLDAAALRSTEF